MTISHHPDMSTLMAFSAGTLDEPYAAVIATHLAMSSGGRAIARRLDLIGGALLNEEQDAELTPGALDRLLAATDRTQQPDEARPETDVPLPLAHYLPDGLTGAKWKWSGPGVAICDLPSSADTSRLMLLRVAAGRPVPEHGHGGHELTLILTGAYRDRFGVFGPGDIADHDEDVEHQPIAEMGADCICLVAVDAPLTFKSRLIRTLQPLFGL
ncbi:ChrR family anti-sigma-E factor [Devosia rhodophyticola]|uniref:ChrR family anti-sigma-E factor n=1 Tax=Devosia rhodophyticola TaxID=3026423 RepID=A0ABY7YXC2_9HYPH|nr:ChrR family anti-sigma-E factor [Devosia rhodophyticola]WDR06035.1 ChrR family anti-sigma-E factor [Devosia rhodophyticola]